MATKYIYKLVIEDEFIKKAELPALVKHQLTEEKLCSICWLSDSFSRMVEVAHYVELILRATEHHLAGVYWVLFGIININKQLPKSAEY